MAAWNWFVGLRWRWRGLIIGVVVLTVIGALTPTPEDDSSTDADPTATATTTERASEPTSAPEPSKTATPPAFPTESDVLAAGDVDGDEVVDFLWRGDALAESERCVESRQGPVRCFAFRSPVTHAASSLDGDAGSDRRPCWDASAARDGDGKLTREADPSITPGECPQRPLGLPAGFWPLEVPDVGSELILEPDGALYVYEIVQVIDRAALCRAAQLEVDGSCAAVVRSDVTPAWEPAIIGDRIHLMPLVWDFRVLIVAPESCYAVDVFPDPEANIDEWVVVSLRLGLSAGSSSLPDDDPGRCPS